MHLLLPVSFILLYAFLHQLFSWGHSLPNAQRLSYCTSLQSDFHFNLLTCFFSPLRSAAEDFDKCPSELDVEGGVNDGVEGAVHVSQPGKSTV